MSEKIFIQIASYRDPELVPTIKDCLEMARHPESLVFSINWQHSEEDEWDTLDEFKDDPRFKIIDMDYKKSKGVCWARNLLQQQYDGEEYTLCIDSHHRFVKHWDEICIKYIKELKELGFKKPILSAYPPSYDPEKYPKEVQRKAWQTNFNKFDENGIVSMIPGPLHDPQSPTPLRGRFYSAGFAFADGSLAKEVPHDPNMYFMGEEITITVRAYTWGYDFFTPTHPIVWHEYTRKHKNKHWLDNRDWGELNRQSIARYHRLFDVDQSRIIHSEPYGFGPHRSIEQYCHYAGISFKYKKAQQYTVDNLPPPNPYKKEEKFEWPHETTENYSEYIRVEKSFFTQVDYDMCAVIFKDDNNNSLFRRDVASAEINKKIRSTNSNTILLWGNFDSSSPPSEWTLWLYSENHGWLNRLDGRVNKILKNRIISKLQQTKK